MWSEIALGSHAQVAAGKIPLLARLSRAKCNAPG
jgi:hypothetical protein